VNNKDIKDIGKLFEKLGKAIQKNPELYHDLEHFVDSYGDKAKSNTQSKQEGVDKAKLQKIDLLDLFQTKGPEHVEKLLADLNQNELKYLMKNHHFGIPSTQSLTKLREQILRQLKQKTTDVFKR
jgi:hypothetical protein